MPIVRLSKTQVTTRCRNCGREVERAVADLVLGNARSPDNINLRPCECGAIETLLRTWDTLADAPPNHHRRAVNALAQLLRERGQSHEAQKEAHAAETATPPDILTIEGTVSVDSGKGDE